MSTVDAAALAAYKSGDELSGRKIRDIVGRNSELMVCTVDLASSGDVGVHWVSLDSVTLSVPQRNQIAAFNGRYDAVKKSFPGDPSEVEALALALYQGLCDPSEGSVFAAIDAKLESAIEAASHKTRAIYGGAAVVGALIGLIVLGYLAVHTNDDVQFVRIPAVGLAFAAAVGSVGALASVLHKLRQIEVSHYPGFVTAAFGGCSRALLGAIFGGVLYVAASLGLALSALVDQPGGPLLLGFIGGISERMVPELVKQLESSASRP
jgi:hypothetical protein